MIAVKFHLYRWHSAHLPSDDVVRRRRRFLCQWIKSQKSAHFPRNKIQTITNGVVGSKSKWSQYIERDSHWEAESVRERDGAHNFTRTMEQKKRNFSEWENVQSQCWLSRKLSSSLFPCRRQMVPPCSHSVFISPGTNTNRIYKKRLIVLLVCTRDARLPIRGHQRHFWLEIVHTRTLLRSFCPLFRQQIN